MGDCYEPSSLIRWVHEKVPFLVIGFNNSGQGAEELVDSLGEGLSGYYDYFVVYTTNVRIHDHVLVYILYGITHNTLVEKCTIAHSGCSCEYS